MGGWRRERYAGWVREEPRAEVMQRSVADFKRESRDFGGLVEVVGIWGEVVVIVK